MWFIFGYVIIFLVIRWGVVCKVFIKIFSGWVRKKYFLEEKGGYFG